MTEVEGLIRQLEAGMQRTFDLLITLNDAELDEPCQHGCARGGTVWNLLTHNIEHEKLHAGQVIGARDRLRVLQQERRIRLIAELYLARAHVIASLIGLPDEYLDKSPDEGQWSVRETVEHLLYWDENSMATLAEEHRSRN